ncbi:MAG TPA: extracellular solute-binding protein [Herpetosiphonaceae bacterium]
MRQIAFFVSLVLVAAVLAACSTASRLPVEPDATAAPTSTTATGAASAAPTTAATSDPTPTVAATAERTSAPTPTLPNALTLWHSYAADSPAAQILDDLIAQARQAAPDMQIAATSIPGDQIVNRFETEAAAGGGPDLLLASSSGLGRQARAGMLRDLDSAVAPQASRYLPNALDSMRVDGKLYGVPASLTTIALYYNTGTIQNPPRTTDELLSAVKGGARIALIRSTFHNFGFFGAFGGRLFDDSGRCVADAGGFAEALNYLRELKAAGAQFVTSGREAEALFKEGQVDLAINGSWLLDDFRAALGEQLGVAPMPDGPGGAASPLLGGTGVYVNANTDTFEQATALALALTSQEVQQRFVEQSAFVPSNPGVATADPALASLAEAARASAPYPQRTELDRFWQPFDGALVEVLENNADPVAAVQSACTAMNEANGK